MLWRRHQSPVPAHNATEARFPIAGCEHQLAPWPHGLMNKLHYLVRLRKYAQLHRASRRHRMEREQPTYSSVSVPCSTSRPRPRQKRTALSLISIPWTSAKCSFRFGKKKPIRTSEAQCAGYSAPTASAYADLESRSGIHRARHPRYRCNPSTHRPDRPENMLQCRCRLARSSPANASSHRHMQSNGEWERCVSHEDLGAASIVSANGTID